MSTLSDNLFYVSPSCRIIGLQEEGNFLASGDYADGGYPGSDLEPGDEYDF